jgi:hypothetical protein
MAVAHSATARKEMLTKKSHRFHEKTPQSSGATISSIPTTTFLRLWSFFLMQLSHLLKEKNSRTNPTRNTPERKSLRQFQSPLNPENLQTTQNNPP